MVSLMLFERYTLGIDIGGTNFRIGLVSADGQLQGYEKQSVATLEGDDPAALLGDAVADYIARYGVAGRVAAICAGFPATVDKERARVLNAPNVRGFDGVPVGHILTERLGIPTLIERDVNLLLVNDMERMAIDSADIAAFYVGTGIGNAMMIGGQLIAGHNGVAGEVGHIPFGDSVQVCGCGNVGCAEPLAGGLYLAHLAREIFPETPVGRLFSEHGRSPELVGFVERLGRVIATEVNIIDPEVVLLGGGVVQMADFPREALEKSILSHTRKPLPHDNLRIVYSDATDGDGGVVGAGIFAWRKIRQ